MFHRILLLAFGTVNAVTYDSFTGEPATREELKSFEESNTTKYCTNYIKLPCDPNERSRIDGSCNNLKYPQRGCIHTPTIRLLPPEYAEGYTNKKMKNGQDYPKPRYVRTEALLVGKRSSKKLNQLSTYYMLFMLTDVGTIQDIINYLVTRPYCCERRGETDDMCTPNLIPKFDPVHRFSHIHCMNLTRPYTFQFFHCLNNDTVPARIYPSTPQFDLSGLYNFKPNSISKLRAFEGGRLKTDVVNGRTYPLSKRNDKLCILNQPPRETRCYAYHPNGVLGGNIFYVWFTRFHNFIAGILKALNPCWDDEKIFYTTRDILIAISLEIYYYQLLPLYFGKENLIRDKVIQRSKGYREIYDERRPPQISEEFDYLHRWFHVAQDATLKMFDKNGCYVRSFPMVNLTARTAYYSEDNNEEYIACGSFRQATDGFTDQTAHPDMTDLGLGGAQLSFDILTADVAKGRLFGFASYVKYREYCCNKKYKKFSDLRDTMDKERIMRLRNIYKNVENIELMVGLWSERAIKGGHVAITLYCLMTEHYRRIVQTDRHWYERKNRPFAFTKKQLREIRKATIAYFMCNAATGVNKIQPEAFIIPGPKNKIVPCDCIQKINFDAWKEC